MCCLELRISTVLIGIFNLLLEVPTLMVLLIQIGYFERIDNYHYLKIFLTILSIVANIFLLEGVHFVSMKLYRVFEYSSNIFQKKPNYLQIWIVFQTVLLIQLFLYILIGLFCMLFIFTEVVPPDSVKNFTIETIVAIQLTCLLAFGLNSYFWYIVRNYQLEVSLEESHVPAMYV